LGQNCGSALQKETPTLSETGLCAQRGSSKHRGSVWQHHSRCTSGCKV